MNVKNGLLLGTLMLAVSACSSVVSESYGSIVVDGDTYDVRNRVIEGPEGSYTQTSVIVASVPRTCLPQSPGDCEAAVRRALNDIDRR